MSSNQSFNVENFEESFKKTHPAGFLLHLVHVSEKKVRKATEDLDRSKNELIVATEEVAKLRLAVISANKKVERIRSDVQRNTCMLEVRANQLQEAVADLHSNNLVDSLNQHQASLLKKRSRLAEDDLENIRKKVAGLDQEVTPVVQPSTAGSLCSNEDLNNSSSESNANENTKCCICWEGNVNSVMYRCGHICTCYQCGMELILTQAEPKCPICRVEITDVIQTFKC